MPDVGIVICYEIGTLPILRACLRSIERHTEDVDYRIYLAYRETKPFDADDEIDRLGFRVNLCPVDFNQEVSQNTSNIHGRMLDLIVPDVDCRHIMTLDSDCFPIADGWLRELIGMVEKGAGCSGILYPYAPPPRDLKLNTIEFRVRAQHCWETTHVACQLVPKLLLDSLGVSFTDGDDTGLMIPALLKDRGYPVEGFKATRCPLPSTSTDSSALPHDPELNRYVSVVFGDKVYHMGGYTRESIVGDEHMIQDVYGWARERVLKENGAEFLLDDDSGANPISYKYTFGREEEVAADKMDRLFGLRRKGL